MQLWGLLSLALALGGDPTAPVATPEKPKLGTAQAKEGVKWAAAMLKKPSTKKAAKTAGKNGLEKVRKAVAKEAGDEKAILKRVEDCGDNCDMAVTQAVLAKQLKEADFLEAETMLTAMVEAFAVVNEAVKVCTPSKVLSSVNAVAGKLPGLSNDSFEPNYKKLVNKKAQAAEFVQDTLCPALKECLLDTEEADVEKLELYVEFITDRLLPGCPQLYSEESVGRLEKIGDSVVSAGARGAGFVRAGGETAANGGKAVGNGLIGAGRGAGNAVGRGWGAMKARVVGKSVDVQGSHSDTEEQRTSLAAMLQVEDGFVVVGQDAGCALELGAHVARKKDCKGCSCVTTVLGSGAATRRLYDAEIYVDPTEHDWSGVKKHARGLLNVYDEVSYVASLSDAAKGLSGPALVVGTVVTAATGGTAAAALPVMALVGGLMDLQKKRHEHMGKFDEGAFCDSAVALIGVEARGAADLDAAAAAEEDLLAAAAEKLDKQHKQLERTTSSLGTKDDDISALKQRIADLEADMVKGANAATPVVLALVVLGF